MGFPVHILRRPRTLFFVSVQTLVIIDSQNTDKSSIIIHIFSAKKRTWDFSIFEPNELRLASHRHCRSLYSQSLLCMCASAIVWAQPAKDDKQLYIMECAGWHNWCSSPLICTIFEWTNIMWCRWVVAAAGIGRLKTLLRNRVDRFLQAAC